MASSTTATAAQRPPHHGRTAWEFWRGREPATAADRFGLWLAGQLHRRGMTMSDLARGIGAYPAVVRRWVRGVQLPKTAQCRAVAAALGLPVDEVLAAAGHRPPDPAAEGGARREAAELLARIPEERIAHLLPRLRALAHDGRRGGEDGSKV